MRKGIVPPLVTPLTEDEGLDDEGLSRLIEHALAGGVHGVFVLGTNGEGLALRDDVKEGVIRRAAEVTNRRVPLLANISDVSTERALVNATAAQRAGADEVVATPPFYFPYPPPAIERFYRQLADSSRLPVWIYENPARTGVTTPFEVIAGLSAHDNIVGIKYSGTDMSFFARLVKELRSPEFVVFTGLVQDNIATLQLGADGIVPGIANLLPRVMVDLYRAVIDGDIETARGMQRTIDSAKAVYGEGMAWWPHAPKVILHQMGILETEVVASPYEPLPAQARAQIVSIWEGLCST